MLPFSALAVVGAAGPPIVADTFPEGFGVGTCNEAPKRLAASDAVAGDGAVDTNSSATDFSCDVVRDGVCCRLWGSLAAGTAGLGCAEGGKVLLSESGMAGGLPAAKALAAFIEAVGGVD